MNDRANNLRDTISKRLVLADGSTGTALEALSPGSSARGGLVALERPELLESLHRAYFEAGSELVETATFSASARGIARAAGLGVDSAEAADLAYRANLAAARIARRAADEAEAASGATRWVAGSLGPGDELPSLGAVGWAELRASYLPQARALADGGADLAFVETCQDPLQTKAALAALASPDGGRGLPFVASATVDARGRLLAGSTLEAFVAVVAPFGPLAIGVNCSSGPDELGAALEALLRFSPFPLSLMPNSGIPRYADGRTVWPLGPEEFAAKTAALALRCGVAIVGGCCGTSPEHVRSLARALAGAREAPRSRPSAPSEPRVWSGALASLYEAKPVGPALFRIGERGNASGSKAFMSALARGDFDEAADIVLGQEEEGADAVDLCLRCPGRDEASDLAELTRFLATRARAALCFDSRDVEALSRALALTGGRAIVNSASLAEPYKARRIMAAAREHGAALVLLGLDGAGPGRRAEDAADICGALYDIALGEFGFSPSSLFVDPALLPAAASPPGSAAMTIVALGSLRGRCPGARTVLGLGNLSYGLPPKARAALETVFLSLAVPAGLDAAVMDCSRSADPATIDRGAAEAAAGLIAGGAAAAGALERLRALA